MSALLKLIAALAILAAITFGKSSAMAANNHAAQVPAQHGQNGAFLAAAAAISVGIAGMSRKRS